MPEENPLLIALYERVKGTGCFAPYVDCVVSELFKTPKSDIFKMRIDTGADFSCVPKKHIKHPRSLLNGCNILSRLGDGRIKRRQLKLVTLSVLFPDDDIRSYRPQRGVLLCGGEHGLLGMDILNSLDVRICNQQLYLSPMTGGAS